MVTKSFLWRQVYTCSTCPVISSAGNTIISMNSTDNLGILKNLKNGRTKNVVIDNFSWLQQKSPGFIIDSSKVKIIHEPSTFYSTLLSKLKNVQKRVILASLYIGTGQLEKNLVNAIEEALIASNGKIKVNILLDYMRGTRGKNNSVKMLQPLLKEKYANSCSISLYHTPQLRGFMKLIIPKRFNELIGLQHMKIYIFDDSLIISGANLSNDYFVNRQDRYFLIEDCKELCDFYSDLINLVKKFSYHLSLNSDVLPPTNTSGDSIVEDTASFRKLAQDKIQLFYTDAIKKSQEKQQNHLNQSNNTSCDTWIYPLIQMGQLGIVYDCEITQRLIKTAPERSILKFATGYFNLTTEYSNALLRDCQASSCNLLTAHPTTNGFYGAKGIAGNIPSAYIIIEKSFLKSCEQTGLGNRITLQEYIRPGWTYHAKGLWYTLPNQKKPSLTLIGSSNFGYRSVNRDLETQIALVTRNAKLQNDLLEEYNRLQKYSHPVTKESLSQYEKTTPSWVYAAVFLFRYYF